MLDRLLIRIATGNKDDDGKGLISLRPCCHSRFHTGWYVLLTGARVAGAFGRCTDGKPGNLKYERTRCQKVGDCRGKGGN